MWPDEATTPVFRGCVFANGGVLASVWRALRDNRLPSAGARAWDPASTSTGAKRRRTTARDAGSPADVTHVVVQDHAAPRAVEEASRAFPRALVVRRADVFAALGGARGVDDRKPRPPPPAPGPPPPAAALVAARALPPDHPNWALVPSRRARAFDDRDRIRHGRSPGATMGVVEALLQCVFDADACSLNEPLVARLLELETYERLAGGDERQRKDVTGGGGGSKARGTGEKFNEEQSAYARAAAAARAFPRALLPGTPPSAIEREVPAFGASLAAQAAEILNTGTCAKLEAFRRGGVVRHRDGRTRAGDPREAAIEGGFGRLLEIERTPDPESAAASARPASASLALVHTPNTPAPAGSGFGFGSAPGTLDRAAAHASSLRALPGFGRVAVARLALAGLDTADKARDAARARTAEAAFLTPAQVHALERHEVLAEPVPREDFEEMRAAVEAAIGAVEIRPSAVENATERTREASEGELVPGGDSDDSSRHSGWRVVPVGGARRSRASHDADFVISHPSLRTAEALRDSGAFAALVSGLDATGRLARAPGAFRRTHEYPPGAFAERAKALDAELDGARQGNLDLHSKLFGLFLCGGGSAASSESAGGRYRRLDAVVVPFAQLPFATVGWTGSKCYNRLLRHHASRRGLCLTSHALVRRGDRRWVGQVADDPEMLRRGLPPGPPAPSRDADGNDWWPPGWDENRRVETERDVFELLGVPYREPNERDAPG